MLKSKNKHAIGLDISDRTIEVVHISLEKKQITLKSSNRVTIPSGVVVGGRIKKNKTLNEAVKKAFKEAKPYPISTEKVVFGLPESQVYTRVFFATLKSEKNIPEAVNKEITKNIPIPENKLTYDVRILSKQRVNGRTKGTRFEILIVAVEKEVVTEWLHFLSSSRIGVEGFDIETFASARGLFESAPPHPFCVVDIGAGSTSIGIFNKHGLQFSLSGDIAGDQFTKSISRALKISYSEADKLKKTHGVSNPEEKVFAVLVKQLEEIRKDIAGAIAYVKRKSDLSVKEIILIGGSSQLKGIESYFEKNLNIPVRRGKSILSPVKRTKVNQLFYLSAIGLAMRNINPSRALKDPFIPLISGDEDMVVMDCSDGKSCEKSELSDGNQSDSPKDMEFLRPDGREFKTPESNSRIRFGFYAFIAVLAVLSFLSWAFFEYQDRQREIVILRSEAVMDEYSNERNVPVIVRISVDEESYSENSAKGKLIETVVNELQEGETVVQVARDSIAEKLAQYESAKVLSINNGSDGSDSKLPVTVVWLVYDSDKAKDLAFSQATDSIPSDVDYKLGEVVYKSIDSVDGQSSSYVLNGVVTLLFKSPYSDEINTAEKIADKDEKNAKAEEEKQTNNQSSLTALITDTPTGWLRVRSSAGTQFPEIDKVNPKERFEVIEILDDWVKIKLDDTREGWVYSGYVTLEDSSSQ